MSAGILTILSQLELINHAEFTAAESLIANEHISSFYALSQIKPQLQQTHIMLAIAHFYGIPLLDIDAYNLEYMPQNILPVEFIIENQVVPLFVRAKRLKLGVSDPTNKRLFTDISFKVGLTVDLILVAEDKLQLLIRQNSNNYFKTINLDDIALEELDFVVDGVSSNDIGNATEDDRPIVKFVHKMIIDAVECGASDIHFEPYEKSYRVRYRIDGVLNEIATPPLSLKEKIAARIKIVAKLDISEKRLPQDGRMRLSISKDHIIDFRVSTLPTVFGEKLVLRIMDRQNATLDIAALGLSTMQQALVMQTIQRPYGMILVTGPTGSGKTITLYSCLSILNDLQCNISTVEDPIEIPLEGINQVAINDKTGLSFAVTLRAFLRQDPDIIMVGEIRDSETAEIAIKAAQTGHLVFSTLHTNDAASALTRLVSMGVPAYNVGDAILAIIAQRLSRKLCDSCKKLAQFDAEILLKAGCDDSLVASGWQPYIAVGCDICHSTGYQGRVGMFEVLPISEAIKKLILNNSSAHEIEKQARCDGILSLRQSGIQKVQAGLTSLTEITALTNA